MRPYAASPEEVERFRRERVEFRLVYRCPDCEHFAPGTGKCSLGYPNRTLMEADGYLEIEGAFVFCKYFEVG
ncbi:MAG: hypothetical protein FJ087_08820 [Deltaproteobacteria bacterium]|nr:hypothetical protein [Deltaproteobacteria bacterium]